MRPPPKLSKAQKSTLILALVKTQKMRRMHGSSSEIFCYAVRREINTVRVLGRLDLICIQTSQWENICTHYELTDAGWLLAQALLDAKTRRIASSRVSTGFKDDRR